MEVTYTRPEVSSAERFEIDKFVLDFNRSLNPNRPTRDVNQNLGRDDFLKILITQLSYQDPTAPMQDKEFIAQMAQFSTLEQMTGMAKDFNKLTAMVSSNEASASLGRSVEVTEGDKKISGIVQAVTRGETPQVLVNGVFYNWDNVSKVFSDN
jgi:flagellar basal-body rod modification protein FlgD